MKIYNIFFDMFSFFQNALGALIGIFLALIFVAHFADKEKEARPEESLSFEEIVPKSTFSYLTEGMPSELLLPVPVTEENLDAIKKDGDAKKEPLVIISKKPETEPVPVKEAIPEAEPSPPPPAFSATELNVLARNATVNIFCTLEGGVDAASGSGVVIDENGVILTNAHIAQYFLLDTRNGAKFITCAIRSGSPAKKSFDGELLYLPSVWIETRAVNITKENIIDTGEHDYALVRIIPPTMETATSSYSFASLAPAYDGAGILRTEPVLVASYPAGFLGPLSVQRNLWQISSFTSIKELYNFPSSPNGVVNVFSLYGTVGAQEGSSGGAVVRAEDGKLLGIVVTRSKGDTTGERELFSLSIPYINTDITGDLKKTLKEFLASDIDAYQEWFNANVRPRLKERLLEEIEKK